MMRFVKLTFLIVIIAVSQGCKKDDSNPVVKDSNAPAVPILATPANTSIGNTQPVTVRWNKSSKAEKYSLQVSTDNLFGNLIVNDTTLTDTAKTLPILSYVTQYYWRVRSRNGSGESGYSNAFSFTTVIATSDTVSKSAKRGLAFDLSWPSDMNIISKGISWWYNWSTKPNSLVSSSYKQAYNMDFIPMLWGGSPSASDIANVKNFIIAHAEVQYLLVMNEPNLVNQANRNPAEAASDWIQYEQVITDLAAQGRTVYLVGPAMTWGTMSGYANPVTWLDAFYAAYRDAHSGRDPKIDYLAFHWYDYGISSQLDALAKYGKKIWVTEMANWNAQINSYAKQEAQMRDMVNTCETRTDVFRYAWFYGRGSFPDSHYTYVFTANDGQLSELGQLYISLPFNK